MRDEIFLTERTELPDGRELFERYDKITGRTQFMLWDSKKGEERYVDKAVADLLKAQAEL